MRRTFAAVTAGVVAALVVVGLGVTVYAVHVFEELEA